MPKRSYWGWGYEDYKIPADMLLRFKSMIKEHFQITEFENIQPLAVEDIDLRAPRFQLPLELQSICSKQNFDRVSHSYGKAFRDVWRAAHGHFPNPPDYVAYPQKEKDIISLMEYAAAHNLSIVPVGGGSSVCGGIEPSSHTKYAGTISVNMKHFNKVLTVDKVSRSAHIQGGMYGPAIEAALKPHGLTLRHYPQSFEFSTLGGWIATRSGGHYATLYTHIDEFVQNVTMITPSGTLSSRRLPGSGAGPSEERLYTGSEGILGIITSAWMRLQDIPQYKKTVTVSFPTFEAGAKAARSLGQSGLYPTNARLIDAIEAYNNGLGDGGSAVLIVGFESHQRSVDQQIEEALVLCREHGGTWEPARLKVQGRSEKGDAWKKSFLAAPYLRDEMVRLGLVIETFETAVTWDQYESFYREVKRAATESIKKNCGVGIVTCRFTHIYPDGPAPYFTIIAKGEQGKQLEQWDQIKSAVSQAIIDHGGTITHHHAVGKDHREHYLQQQSPLFGKMLRAAKLAVDPTSIMNPGVLLSEEETKE